ncbi:MAG: caspase family protein [Hyphomicrobiaceae bacterium]
MQFAVQIGTLRADEPSPILRLDTGGHMGLVRNVIFSPDGTRLISAGDDKAIRIWKLADGQTERTILGEIGEGEDGKILAMALSPDGTTLAVGGRLRGAQGGEAAIRIIDLASGEVMHLLEGHDEGILSLAFSPDGTLLASGSMDDTAILWSVSDYHLVRRVAGHQGDVNAVRFTLDGKRLVTASDDTVLGLWDLKDGHLVSELGGHSDVVVGLAISPVDGTIASGALDKTIRLWNPDTGAPIKVFDQRPSSATSLAFSPDGRLLLAAADHAPFEQDVYDVVQGRRLLTYRGHDGLTHAVAFSPDGESAVSAGGSNNEVHLWSPKTAKVQKILAGTGRAVWTVGISADGERIAWGHTDKTHAINRHGPLELALRLPGSTRAPTDPTPLAKSKSKFLTAKTEDGALKLVRKGGGDWGYFAVLELHDGEKLRAVMERDENDGYGHDSFTLLGPNKIASGAGHGWLTLYETDSRRIGELIGHTSNIWSVAGTADGRRLVSGGDDQTIRLWNAETLEPILTFFRGRDGEWVMWTPEGYYAASPNGDGIVGWHINQGPDKSARFVTAAQLKRHFYRPDILQQAVALGSARRAVASAKGTTFTLDELLRRRPPELALADGIDGQTVDRSPLRLMLHIEANDDPVERYAVTVNGRQVIAIDTPLDGAGPHDLELEVPLAAGSNGIAVVVENAVGRSERTLSVSYAGSEDLERRETLYIVAIGVDDYPKLGQNLSLAGADAESIARRIAETAGPFHRRIVTTVLAKGEALSPTAANIDNALASLKAAGPRDTVVVFLAGHGVNDGPNYLFLPTDAALDGTAWRMSSVVRWQRLQEMLQSTRGRRIMLVDTCHAGNAFNARLVKDAADASIVVLAATDADTLAEERSDLGHGVFTYAMLQGLAGKADLTADNRIRTGELATFVGREVERLTKGQQRPEAHVSKLADFVLARRPSAE